MKKIFLISHCSCKWDYESPYTPCSAHPTEESAEKEVERLKNKKRALLIKEYKKDIRSEQNDPELTEQEKEDYIAGYQDCITNIDEEIARDYDWEIDEIEYKE